MPDNRYQSSAVRRDCFREAVCVNASRIYDACRDRECLEDLPVYFTEQEQNLVNNAAALRLKCAEVIDAVIDTEPVPFNKGFYCVDITVFLECRFDAAVSPVGAPTEVRGLCAASKKAVLFGSEGCVKIFSSSGDGEMNSCSGAKPRVVCQIAEPVALGCRTAPLRESANAPCLCLTDAVAARFAGGFEHCCACRAVFASVGIFMVIQLEREVQMLMPVYDFCLPDKVCIEQTDSTPCELFSRIGFPTEAFFPPAPSPKDRECGNKQ